MKNESVRVVKILYSYTFEISSAANSVVGGQMWRIIKLIQAFMDLHVTCKNEEDPFKMKVLKWSQKISHCTSMQIFMRLKGS